jgi:tetratricopeptide (TPR) repeat protein
MQRNFSTAIRHCQAVLEVDETHVMALFRLGQLYRVQHDYEHALEYLHRARSALMSRGGDGQSFALAPAQIKTMEKAIDKCKYDQSQYDLHFVRAQLRKDNP